MKTSRYITPGSLVLLCAVAAGFPTPVSAAELLSLSPVGEKGFRGASDPIEIRIGREMPAELTPYLRVEIDAIDVSDFVQRNKQMLVYRPPQPLESGQHELRVVAVLPDGAIEEAALWTVEVRASRAFRVASFNSNVSLQAMRRVSDDLNNPPPDRTQGQGAVELSSRHADNDWNVTSQASMLYNSRKELNLTGEELELSSYQLKSEWTQSSAVLGHQALTAGSLVLTDFNRRGLSASYHSEEQRFAATGFSTRTEEIVGFDHFTGVDDSRHLTSGIIVSGYPLETRPERLAVSAVYLDAEGNSQGVAEVDDISALTAGSAQAIIVDSYLDNKVWRLRGEYATTNFDFDGKNIGLEAEQDNAVSLLVGYDPARDESATEESDSTWNVSMQHQRVGPWFYSLGNTSVVADRQTTQVTGNYQGTELGINATVSLAEDNVDDIENVPTTEISAASINLSYVPQAEPEQQQTEQDSNPLISPSYTLSFNRNSLDQIKTPGGFLGDDVNSRNQELAVGATFSAETWTWTVSQSWIKQVDKVFPNNDVDTNSTGLEWEMTFDEIFSVAPTLQRSLSNYSNLGVKSKSWLAGATFNLNYPENWKNSFAYTASRETASDGSINSRNRVAELSLQWNYREAKENQFGVSFFTSASRRKTEDSGFGTETDEYQVFLGVNIAWPASI